MTWRARSWPVSWSCWTKPRATASVGGAVERDRAFHGTPMESVPERPRAPERRWPLVWVAGLDLGSASGSASGRGLKSASSFRVTGSSKSQRADNQTGPHHTINHKSPDRRVRPQSRRPQDAACRITAWAPLKHRHRGFDGVPASASPCSIERCVFLLLERLPAPGFRLPEDLETGDGDWRLEMR